MLMHGGLLPAGAGLQPEDRRRYTLSAITNGLAVEALGDAGIGLDAAALQLVGIGGLEFLPLDGKHAGDIRRGQAVARQSLDPGCERPVILDRIVGVAHWPGFASQIVTGSTSVGT